MAVGCNNSPPKIEEREIPILFYKHEASNLCFAFVSVKDSRLISLAEDIENRRLINIPCTPEVEKLIDNPKARCHYFNHMRECQ